jgi:acyl carrier protein
MDKKEKIINIIYNNLEKVDENDTMNNHNDLLSLGINSIMFIKIVVDLEKEFNIEFDDEMLDVQKFISLETLYEYIDKQCQQVNVE